MNKRARIFTTLTAAALGAQAVHCALLEAELRGAPLMLVDATECDKCGEHIDGHTPEGKLVGYKIPHNFHQVYDAWRARHRDTHTELKLHYSIEYRPRGSKPIYIVCARVNGIPFSEAIKQMEQNTFPTTYTPGNTGASEARD